MATSATATPVTGPPPTGRSTGQRGPGKDHPSVSRAGRSSWPAGWPGDRLPRLLPSVLPALVMLVVGAYRLDGPALGWDENATLSVATRPVGQILRLASNTDGSIAPYYLFMHFWTALFGTSEISLRMPSLIGMAVGVGLTGELGRRLFTPGVGLLGGLLLTTVPTTSRYAQEARTYGLTFMLVALATLLLYRALDRPARARWAGYGVTVCAVGLAHLIGLTILAGHGLVLLLRRHRGQPAPLRDWLVSAGLALAPLAPLMVLGLGQRGEQLGWVTPVNLDTLRTTPTALFGVPTVSWLFIGLACTARWVRRRPVVELALLTVVPPAALLLVSVLTDPFWVVRYILFALAPLALLVALALRGHPVRIAVACVSLLLVVWPAQMEIRGPATHHGPDFREIAAIISAGQQPGDGIVYAESGNWSLRVGIDYYLPDQAAPRDLLLRRSAGEVGELAAQECADPARCLGRAPRIWLVQLLDRASPLVPHDPLASAGEVAQALQGRYQAVHDWRLINGEVTLFSRLAEPTR